MLPSAALVGKEDGRRGQLDLATTDTLAYTSGMYRYPDDRDKKEGV